MNWNLVYWYTGVSFWFIVSILFAAGVVLGAAIVGYRVARYLRLFAWQYFTCARLKKICDATPEQLKRAVNTTPRPKGASIEEMMAWARAVIVALEKEKHAT